VRSGASFRQALGAVGVLFSLSWVVAEACVLGLVRPQGVFLRTPKARSNSSVIKAATSTRTEGMLVVAAVMVGARDPLTAPGQPGDLHRRPGHDAGAYLCQRPG